MILTSYNGQVLNIRWQESLNLVICSKPVGYMRSKLWLFRTHISYRKELSSLWIVLSLISSITESVSLILSIQQKVGLWGRPDGIEKLLRIFTWNYDVALISHPTFICYISGNSYKTFIILTSRDMWELNVDSIFLSKQPNCSDKTRIFFLREFPRPCYVAFKIFLPLSKPTFDSIFCIWWSWHNNARRANTAYIMI